MFRNNKERKKEYSYINRFLKVMLKNNKRIIIIGVFFLTITTIIGVFMPQIVRKIIDVAIPNKDDRLLILLIGFYIGLTIIGAFFQVGKEYNFSKLKNKICIRYKLKILKKLTQFSGENFQEFESGEILKIISSDCEVLQSYGMDLFVEMLTDIGTACFSIYFLISMEARLFGGLVFLLLFVLYIQKIYSREITKRSKEVRILSGNIFSLITEFVSNIMEIIISKGEIFFIVNYIKKQKKIIQDNIKLDIIFSGYNTTGILLISFITALIYGFGGFSVIKGNLSLGKLIVFQEYAIMFIGSCNNLLKSKTEIKQLLIALERIYTLLDLEPIIKFDNNGEKIKNIEKIKLENISFLYRENVILDKVEFQLNKGQTYALIGKSGSGKSTIVKLLFRLWDVSKGNIFINDIPIKNYNLKSLRKNITIISQEMLLVNDTIKNNILLGNVKISDDILDDICQKVGLKELLEELPKGYETIIGERGNKLSRGQRQRIVIARALLSQTSMIIFDEATSALDNITQEYILNNIQGYFKNKIILIIAHRLSTIENADKIFVLECSNIKEAGTHQELINKRGAYYKMLRGEVN